MARQSTLRWQVMYQMAAGLPFVLDSVWAEAETAGRRMRELLHCYQVRLVPAVWF